MVSEHEEEYGEIPDRRIKIKSVGSIDSSEPIGSMSLKNLIKILNEKRPIFSLSKEKI